MQETILKNGRQYRSHPVPTESNKQKNLFFVNITGEKS